VRPVKSDWSCMMSALGQKQTLECVRAMSALPPKADIAIRKESSLKEAAQA